MRGHRKPRRGDGTAWLVVDRLNGDYLCYWYTGTNDAHLVEHARVASASDAVAWGRLRTSRVRIRTADACTYWAGTAPRPEGFTHTWTAPDTTSEDHPSPGHDTSPTLPDRAGEPDDREHTLPLPAQDEPIPAPTTRETAGVGHAASEGSRC